MSWNEHFANTGEKRDTYCWRDIISGKFERKLTQKQAKCYWTNYPMAGLAFQNQGVGLSLESAEYDWNYRA